MNYNDFGKYYVKHLGKSSSNLDYYSKQIESSMTPYILEEREMRATQIDIFSGGAGGNIQDARVTFKEWEKINDILFDLLGEYCDKPSEQVKLDASRDLWLDSQEALDYGIIDEIVKTKKGS